MPKIRNSISSVIEMINNYKFYKSKAEKISNNLTFEKYISSHIDIINNL